MGEGKKIPKKAKGRWVPTNNTRPSVMPDRKKKENKKAARGRVNENDS